MIGLFLQGGGAKGAFQAGALCGLHEVGVHFNVITGTSIGAINGYFVLKNGYEEMKNTWLSGRLANDAIDIDAPIIESSGVLKFLECVRGCKDDRHIQHFYINYVPVVNRRLTHEWADLCCLDEDERFMRIRQSSLLPKAKGVDPLDGGYSLSDMAERFQEDLCQGVYDHYTLDGGLVNNLFLEPFIEKKVDYLIMIVFKPDFQIPTYISDTYSKEKLVVIKPKLSFEKGATMNFSEDFIASCFQEGYELGKTIVI